MVAAAVKNFTLFMPRDLELISARVRPGFFSVLPFVRRRQRFSATVRHPCNATPATMYTRREADRLRSIGKNVGADSKPIPLAHAPLI